ASGWPSCSGPAPCGATARPKRWSTSSIGGWALRRRAMPATWRASPGSPARPAADPGSGAAGRPTLAEALEAGAALAAVRVLGALHAAAEVDEAVAGVAVLVLLAHLLDALSILADGHDAPALPVALAGGLADVVAAEGALRAVGVDLALGREAAAGSHVAEL